jgi:hypothetical protein
MSEQSLYWYHVCVNAGHSSALNIKEGKTQQFQQKCVTVMSFRLRPGFSHQQKESQMARTYSTRPNIKQGYWFM